MKGEGLTTKFFGVQLLLYYEAVQSYCLIAAIPTFPCKYVGKRRKKGKKEWGCGEMCGENVNLLKSGKYVKSVNGKFGV